MTTVSLSGKVIFITGAARRIGAVIARVLHEHGATVVVHYRDSREEALALKQELNALRPGSCLCVQADLLHTSELTGLIDFVVQQTGRLDALINNASAFYATPLGTIDEQQWDELFGSNVKAPLFLAQAASDALMAQKGTIINLVDIHAFRPLARHSVYCMAKAGLLMLTRSLAWELAPHVRVNGVAPGAILWPESNLDENSGETPEILDKTALKRMGKPDDIARAVLYLLKDAPYVTGHIIPVDGGRLLHQ